MHNTDNIVLRLLSIFQKGAQKGLVLNITTNNSNNKSTAFKGIRRILELYKGK